MIKTKSYGKIGYCRSFDKIKVAITDSSKYSLERALREECNGIKIPQLHCITRKLWSIVQTYDIMALIM